MIYSFSWTLFTYFSIYKVGDLRFVDSMKLYCLYKLSTKCQQSLFVDIFLH